MEYLDFELPIKELEDQLDKCQIIGQESDVDVTNTCKQIEKKLEGTKVNPKYQKDYGKTYNKKEAHEAATNIKGAMRTKYGI